MTEIKVGDTVRIKDTQPEEGYASKGIGEEFVVTALESTSAALGAKPDFALGDKEFTRLGVFLKHLELVKSDPRWRYNDHIVVYPDTRDANGPGRGVTVLDETPLPKIYTRWENRPETEGDEITAAARAYWEAHPAPKPAWYHAKEGEVWIVTYEGFELPAIFQAGRFRDHGGGWDFEDITSARRIYPEPTE